MVMGSRDERPSRRRSRSPSIDSSDDDRRKTSKHKHKHPHKHKSHKKHAYDVNDAQLKAAKAFLEQHLQHTGGAADGGDPGGSNSSRIKSRSKEQLAGSLPAGVPELSSDDYFERSSEFTLWLQETKHQYFNELTTQQTRKFFDQFVSAWNSGQLPLRYYQGLAAAPLKRTSYSWGFKSKSQQGSAIGKLGMSAFLKDQQEQQAQDHAQARTSNAADRSSWRREQRELLDEMVPKATAGTREARVEARVARRQEARAREESPDTVPVPGGGRGGDDSFEAAKAREAKRQDWRQKQAAAKKEELASKLSAAAQAEADKMARFRALVAAQGGQITIPKRQ